MIKRLTRLLSLILLITFTACQEKEPQVVPQPDGYLKLLEKYENGEAFKSATFEPMYTRLTFESSGIELMKAVIPVVNCTDGRVPTMTPSSSTHTWLVDGVDTGYPNTEGKSLEESYPVRVYILDGTLFMKVSNGQLLEYPTAGAGPGPGKPEKFNMPRVFITHSSDRIHKSYYIDATIKIVDTDGHYSDVKTYTGKTQVKGHGNSTWDYPKKPMRLKLSEEQRVLGMPKNRDWVLLANYFDKSLLRNATAMKMSEMAEMDWTPRYRIVEVYLNNQYQGVYTLFEAKEVTKNKVNIDLDAGDFYLEIEQNCDEPRYFWTSRCSVPIQFKEPEQPSDDDFNYIQQFMNDFESALYSSSFKDKNVGYAKYIDVDSFINNYIIEELAKDIDGNVRKSSFMVYEAATKKVKFYHEWDFDLCFGNADYFPDGLTGANGDNNGPKGWWIKDYNTASWRGDSWYNRLFKDPAFVSAVKARWTELYPALETIPDYIDVWVEEMGDAPTRNFKQWDILGTYVWPNVKVTGSYKGEVAWLKEFYTERLHWINDNLPSL